MEQKLRQSIPARAMALGFIVVILCGNLWVAEALLGQTTGPILQTAFILGASAAILGGFALMGLMLYRRFLLPPTIDTDIDVPGAEASVEESKP